MFPAVQVASFIQVVNPGDIEFQLRDDLLAVNIEIRSMVVHGLVSCQFCSSKSVIMSHVCDQTTVKLGSTVNLFEYRLFSP